MQPVLFFTWCFTRCCGARNLHLLLLPVMAAHQNQSSCVLKPPLTTSSAYISFLYSKTLSCYAQIKRGPAQ